VLSTAAAVHAAEAAARVAAMNPIDATGWLSRLGALGVFLVLFAETGLLIGFLLPGDTLLFTAGVLCASGKSGHTHLSLVSVLPAAAGGALLGAQVGYWLGRHGGRALLKRNQDVRRGAERAEKILRRYGYGKAIVLSRFIPIVRTVLNPLAGALEVPARTFVPWQILGGLLWAVGVTMIGYLLGTQVPGIDRYVLPGVAVAIGLSLIPAGVGFWRARRKR
jgi:membrane-associated protein